MCVECMYIYVYVVLCVLLSLVLVFLFLVGFLMMETRKVIKLPVCNLSGTFSTLRNYYIFCQHYAPSAKTKLI